jgi:ATP-binding cassette, subfamily B, bacterial
MPPNTPTQKGPGLFSLLLPYKWLIAALVLTTLVSNGFNLWIPKIIAGGIDSFVRQGFSQNEFILEFFLVAFGVFAFTFMQNIVQTYAAERVARDLRGRVAAKLSLQENAYIEKVSPAKLLTNLTSDIDAIKNFVSQAIASLISSFFLIIGASILLLLINWVLALAVLIIVPIIGITFYLILMRVRKLFKRSQEAIDWLNKVINESILGAALIRLLNAHQPEYEKFIAANTESKNIGMSILRLFATLIPVITFTTNLATLIILSLGGYFVIGGTMSLGNFTAFNSYLAILIFPIIIIGFMSNVISQASASYDRIAEVLAAEEKERTGTLSVAIRGDVDAKNISLAFGERAALKDVSLSIKAGTKTAIIGPTAAGKTQLLYILMGLISPSSGEIQYDRRLLQEYDPVSFHNQVGFVFQDSIIFNLSVRENIAFSAAASDESIAKAIATAELDDFIGSLPQGLDTVVSERGASLSGGQKQRIMLARALALNPSVLLLDDFTARVDNNTEAKILANITREYPNLTLISVTQKISSIEHYDQILLLMEGELLARGTHEELLKTSPEYVQIFNSQRSTEEYET